MDFSTGVWRQVSSVCFHRALWSAAFLIDLDSQHEGATAALCVSPWVITSLIFLGVDLVRGLVFTLLRATECSSFSPVFPFSSPVVLGGGSGGDSTGRLGSLG